MLSLLNPKRDNYGSYNLEKVLNFSSSLACSRRSDSGQRCELKRSAKKKKKSAFFTSHCSLLSECLEQASSCLEKSLNSVKVLE